MREYTLKITEDENGIQIKRLNDGFTAFEILGALQIATDEIKSIVKGQFRGNVDKIERSVVVEKDYPLVIDVCPTRLLNALKWSKNYDLNTLTLQDLYKERRKLLYIRNIGEKSIKELNEIFREYKLLT